MAGLLNLATYISEILSKDRMLPAYFWSDMLHSFDNKRVDHKRAKKFRNFGIKFLVSDECKKNAILLR